MDMNALRTFERVAATGSFTDAAHHFRRSVSSISRQIHGLEEALGQPLFYRHTRAVTLTEAGRRYYEDVRKVLEQLDLATDALQHPAEHPSGTLRINAPVAFGQHQVIPLLTQFQRRFPGVTADLHLSDTVVDPIKEGHDLTFRVGDLTDSSLIARPLAPMNYVVAGAPDYLERRGVPTTLEALKHHDCLVYQGELGRQRWHFQQGEAKEVALDVSGPLISNDASSLLNAALLGQGLVIFPTWVIGDALKQKRLIPVLRQWRCEVMPGRRQLYVLTSERRLTMPKVRSFMEYLFDALAPTPPWDRWEEVL
ncbi:LysR family transcriptional regulator [Larsenimonas suaedae]|uniref:LysR family transcriptional regulator n=1 Tax=Larsenimonas suaedae TaxID=1851019 RepID=A0ABU1GXK1_9GAMM|nr:LysR family transcriptional regulator [Larsenimonas suaedae]MCM2971526.1 LysR family transcriptional regulator [Larsenimonas suaedae]MDR5896782.1 LysR family transcriptional regulator [Larsenimonas suaedae]